MYNQVIKNIKYISYTYLTPFPYELYNESIRNGNFGICGVGLGLINSQKIFWFSNTCSAILLYNRNNINFYFVNMFLLFLCSVLYIKSFMMAYELTRYLNITH